MGGSDNRTMAAITVAAGGEIGSASAIMFGWKGAGMMMASPPAKKERIELRYAGYIEDKHEGFLDKISDKRNLIINDSPYDGYIPVDIDSAFFCVGNTISVFPSLYDMFGKFMSGFDVEKLWHYIFGDSLNATEINSGISAEMKLVDDDVTKNILPDFKIMMRNINSVVSSSFVIGKSVIENARIKALSKISSEAKFQVIPRVQERFNASLNWGKKAVTSYAEAMKLYYMTKMDGDDVNYTFDVKDKLWPFEALDFERAALGTLQGTSTWDKTEEKYDPITKRWILRGERSTISKLLVIANYTVTGAYIGSMISPGWGTVIGAVVGFVIGVAYVMLE